MELYTVCFRENYWWNKIFFCSLFPLVNPSVIIFFYYQWTYRRIKYYWWKIHQRRHSIGDFIGNFFTNGMVVQMSTKNSVSKSKDFDSVLPLMFIAWNLLKFPWKTLTITSLHGTSPIRLKVSSLLGIRLKHVL
jgi:hypothetical protein